MNLDWLEVYSRMCFLSDTYSEEGSELETWHDAEAPNSDATVSKFAIVANAVPVLCLRGQPGRSAPSPGLLPAVRCPGPKGKSSSLQVASRARAFVSFSVQRVRRVLQFCASSFGPRALRKALPDKLTVRETLSLYARIRAALNWKGSVFQDADCEDPKHNSPSF